MTAALAPEPGDRAPLLSFDEAVGVGQQLHDHWLKLSGAAPMRREDMGWGDVVQFILRTARDVADARVEPDAGEECE